MSETNPRFQVREIPGRPYGRYVVDTWMGTLAAEFWDKTGEGAQLLAETRASELNLPSADPLGFVSKLALWIGEAREDETNPGDILEDVDRILEHYIGQLRGVTSGDLDQDHLHFTAPWVNRHGLGAA